MATFMDSIWDEVWSRLAGAVSLDDHPFRSFTLATVDSLGAPQARLMTLRGVDRVEHRIWVHSHQRASKIVELTANPAFAGNFFDPATLTTVRLRGTAACHLFDSSALAQFSRACTAAPHRNAADLLWPGSTDLLQRAITRKAFREFVAIALTVEEIVWMQVTGSEVWHVRLRESDAWTPENMPD